MAEVLRREMVYLEKLGRLLFLLFLHLRNCLGEIAFAELYIILSAHLLLIEARHGGVDVREAPSRRS